jgi:hypothetical protein
VISAGMSIPVRTTDWINVKHANGHVYAITAEDAEVSTRRKDGVGANGRTAKYTGGGAIRSRARDRCQLRLARGPTAPSPGG